MNDIPKKITEVKYVDLGYGIGTYFVIKCDEADLWRNG